MKPYPTFFEEAGGAGDGGAGGAGGGAPPTPAPFEFFDATTGAFKPGWTERLPDTLKPAAADFQKYPDIRTFMEGAWNAKQLVGKKSEGVRIPGPDAKPEEIAAFNKALGIPDKPDGYELKKPEKLPEGTQWDEGRLGKLKEIAHANGITPKALSALIEFNLTNNAEVAAQRKLEADRVEAERQKENRTKLETTYGSKLTEKANLATRAAMTFGLDPKSPLFNDAEIVMAFAKIGEAMSEDKLVSAGAVTQLQDKRGQAMDVMKNPNNPYHARYHSGDREVNEMVQRLLGRQ